MSETARPPAVAACLGKARRAVLWVLLIMAVPTAVGLGLARVAIDERALAPQVPARWFHTGLIAVFVGSYVLRRSLANRDRLREPSTRCRRFVTAHALGAAVGAAAFPLGLAYHATGRPEPRELAPFWIAALAAGFLAYPRGYELDDFDEPTPAPPNDRPIAP